MHELVYPALYKQYKNKNRLDLLIRAFDLNAIMTLDRLREFMNCKMYINVYDKGFTESGLRHPTNNSGSPLSQHVYGRAFDARFYSKKWNPEKLREHMKSIGCFEDGFLNRSDAEAFPFLYIRRIEWLDDMPWFHFDTWEADKYTDHIVVFPKVKAKTI
jgi:hypothetical protein